MLELLIDDTSLSKSSDFLVETLDPIDYVIYWCCEQAYTYKIRTLSKEFLSNLLSNHSSTWIEPDSKLKSRLKGATSKDYIQSLVGKQLISNYETACALQTVVLERYDELKSLPKDRPYEELVTEAKLINSQRYAEAAVHKLVDLLQDKAVWVEGKKYTKSNMIELYHDLSRNLDGKFSMSANAGTREALLGMLAKTAANHEIIVQPNLGKDNLMTPLKRGGTYQVVAKEKVGKTKLVLGEFVYEALMNGKNVRICSGEMDTSEVLANIIAKHIYVETDLSIPPMKIAAYVCYIAAMELGNEIPKDIIDSVRKMTKVEIELIDTAFNELTFGNKYGKLFMPYARDDKQIQAEGDDFKIKGGYERMVQIIVRDELDLIVFDHMGFFHSPDLTQSNTPNVMEAGYRLALDIAKNNTRPVGVICINHLKTDADTSDIDNIRAYGTSAAGKDATVFMALTQTKEEAIDGIATLIIKADRNKNQNSDMGTSSFQLVVNKCINDFVLAGTVKRSYVRNTYKKKEKTEIVKVTDPNMPPQVPPGTEVKEVDSTTWVDMKTGEVIEKIPQPTEVADKIIPNYPEGKLNFTKDELLSPEELGITLEVDRSGNPISLSSAFSDIQETLEKEAQSQSNKVNSGNESDDIGYEEYECDDDYYFEED